MRAQSLLKVENRLLMAWSTGTSPRSFICPVLCVVHYVRYFGLFSGLNQSLNTWISSDFCCESNYNLNGGRFALFLLPSACADDPSGDDFSRACCGEVGLVRLSLSPKAKYEWTPLFFESCGIFWSKKLMVVIGACERIGFLDLVRSLVADRLPLFISLARLSVSLIGFVHLHFSILSSVLSDGILISSSDSLEDHLASFRSTFWVGARRRKFLYFTQSLEGSSLNQSLVQSTKREIDSRREDCIEKQSRK